jgi:hypothetical protein
MVALVKKALDPQRIDSLYDEAQPTQFFFVVRTKMP